VSGPQPYARPALAPVVDANGDQKVFSAVWCKSSSRKHKKWEDDAVLVVRAGARLAILRDLEGRDLARGSGLASVELAQLGPGSEISFGGKDVEVQEALPCLPPTFNKQQRNVEAAPPLAQHRPRVLSNTVFKPFQVPVKYGEPDIPTATGPSQPRPPKPMFDPEAANALVLPRPPPGMARPLAFKTLPMVEVVVDPHLSRRLRPHQREGVAFLYRCLMGFGADTAGGAILADEMGLGKTLQTISLIWTLLKQGPWGGRPVAKRALVLTPSSLMHNWQAEFTKWLGSERISTFVAESGPRVLEYLRFPAVSPVLILSYEMFVRSFEDISAPGRPKFDLLVCDEGHRLKNDKIKASTMLTELDIERKIVLTGTPLQNDLKEFFALVNIVHPQALGEEFFAPYG